ncbi:MAG: riboflavin kinase, partial [Ignavibacteriota bacterium]
ILPPEHKLIPADGVYSGFVFRGKSRYLAAISIGTRPTVADVGERKIEAYILDFDDDIYGEELILGFETFIRKQEKFNTLNDLIEQMTNDVLRIRRTAQN